MFCSECGANNEAGAKFCERCGKEMKGINISRLFSQKASMPIATVASVKRPLPVVLIAIYFAFGGVFGLVISTIAGWSIIALPDQSAGFLSYGRFDVFKAALLVMFIEIISLLCIASVYGLWNFIQWGRFLVVGISAVSFISSLIGLFSSNAGGILIGIFNMIATAIIIWYLIMSDVSKEFID